MFWMNTDRQEVNLGKFEKIVELLGLFAIVILGFVLRFYKAGKDSFWLDEAGQALTAVQPHLIDTLMIVRQHAGAMPLDYLVCGVLGASRSSQYYAPKAVDESRLEADIDKVCAQFPRYGYRRITAEIKRRGWLVNRKHIARLMSKLDLQAKKPAPYPRYPNLVESLQVARPVLPQPEFRPPPPRCPP